MAKKTAKQMIDEVIAKVNAELPPKEKVVAKPIEVEHYFRCMTIVVPGSECNCYAGNK